MKEKITREVNARALAAARDAGVDLSKLLTEALLRRFPELTAAEQRRAARDWYEENKEAIDAYNELLEEHGLFSDGMRTI